MIVLIPEVWRQFEKKDDLAETLGLGKAWATTTFTLELMKLPTVEPVALLILLESNWSKLCTMWRLEGTSGEGFLGGKMTTGTGS